MWCNSSVRKQKWEEDNLSVFRVGRPGSSGQWPGTARGLCLIWSSSVSVRKPLAVVCGMCQLGRSVLWSHRCAVRSPLRLCLGRRNFLLGCWACGNLTHRLGSETQPKIGIPPHASPGEEWCRLGWRVWFSDFPDAPGKCEELRIDPRA